MNYFRDSNLFILAEAFSACAIRADFFRTTSDNLGSSCFVII